MTMPAARGLLPVLALVLGLAFAAPLPACAEAPDFRLSETLGQTWSGERVRFPLTPSQRAEIAAGAALVDAAGRVTPFEAIGDGPDAAIEMLADLQPFGEASWALRRGVAPAASQFVIEEQDGLLRVTSAKSGIALRTSSADGAGPIAEVRTAGGSWIGASTVLAGPDTVVGYSAEVKRRGPVAVEVACRTTFASGVRWDMLVMLVANDPAILIEERWSDWSHAAVHIDFSRDFPATHIYYRGGGGGNLSKVLSQPLKPASGDIVHVLEPWLHWWVSERQGTWLAAYGEASPDALVAAALKPDIWIEATEVGRGRQLAPITVRSGGSGFRLELPASGRRRSWLIALMPRAEAIDLSLLGKRERPPPQRLVIRHGDFPLERIRHAALAFGNGEARRPRLMLEDADIARMRALGPLPDAAVARMMALPLNDANLGAHVEAYLRSGDAVIGRKIVDEAARAFQKAVDYFFEQGDQVTMGFAPHQHRNIAFAAHLADFAFSDPAVGADVRRRLLAQAAFLGNLVSRPDYWAPELGFGANPNMTSMVAGYQGLFGCLLREHPDAGKWLASATKELFENEMLGWSDENGGWLEAPHYALVSYDFLLGIGICARNAAGAEQLYHPRMRKIAEWLAKITTPPDARYHGRRHLPPIGNSYMLEDTSHFGTLAQLWRERDPEFSAQMQWMHMALGAPLSASVGSREPLLAPYQNVLKDAALPSRMPAYSSELFPQTGAILRSHFGTDRETQLHIIAGANHAHYDYDSGSVTIWGKGRIIADDFGYYGRAPAGDHSMLDTPSAERIMRVQAFATTGALDYVAGRSGQWTRQAVLIKDRDPLGPNYVVLRDELRAGKGGTWRLWLTGPSVSIEDGVVRVTGAEDVDTDIFILSRSAAAPRLETITRTTLASGLGRAYPSTQTALTIDLPAGDAVVAVIVYPRLKSEPSPRLLASPDGTAARLETAHGTDSIFLAHDTFAAHAEDVSFDGTVGAVLRRGSRHTLALGAGGALSAGTRALVAKAAGAQTFAN